MPYQSLIALGSRHPQTLNGVGAPRPRPMAVQRFRPCSRSGTQAASIDSYLGPAPTPHLGRSQIDEVHIRRPFITVHPLWRNTPIAGAIGPDGMLDLQRITTKMMCALSRPMRASLMELLAAKTFKIRWRDDNGRHYRRQHLLGMPVGKRWRANGATALVMRMAAEPDECAYRQALRDGLLFCVDELQGPEGGNIFSTADVASIVADIIDDLCSYVDPPLAMANMAALSTLISHTLRQGSRQAPNALHEEMRTLLQALGSRIPRDAAHIGLALGLILAGGIRYAAALGGSDYRRRWRVASIANMLWAFQNFIPLGVVSGATSSVIVGGAIWWDYLHPTRDFSDVVRRFEGEFNYMALHNKVFFTVEEGHTMMHWMRNALAANNCSG